jgi:hypothetical protein
VHYGNDHDQHVTGRLGSGLSAAVIIPCYLAVSGAVFDSEAEGFLESCPAGAGETNGAAGLGRGDPAEFEHPVGQGLRERSSEVVPMLAPARVAGDEVAWLYRFGGADP